MRKTVLLMTLLVGSAHAQPTASTYDDALKRGRMLARQGDVDEALKAFNAALAAKPDDPTALSELGFTALRAGKLAEAHRYSERAVERAEGNARAAALYNLGRVEEQMGNFALASEDYKKSLALRKSRTVEARLASLAHGAPAAAGDLDVTAMSGPFDAAALKRELCGSGACDPLKSANRPIKSPAAPYLDILIFSGKSGDSGEEAHRLIMRTRAGYYFTQFHETQNLYGNYGPHEQLAIDQLALVAASGKAKPVVVLRYHVSDHGRSDDAEGETEESNGFLVVCGMGEAPSCSSPIQVAAELRSEKKKRAWSVRDAVTSEQIELTKDKGSPSKETKALLGKHRLQFD